METTIHPSQYPILGIPGYIIAAIILVIALGFFGFIMYRRICLLKAGKADPRLDHLGARFWRMIVYAFCQWRQPRYPVAGIIHILLFVGFMTLSLRSLTLIGVGFDSGFTLPFLHGSAGVFYSIFKDFVELIVLVACAAAIVRRAIFRPSRYHYPGSKGHERDAYVILGLVSALMITDMLYEGSEIALSGGLSALLPASTIAGSIVGGMDGSSLNALHIWS